METTSKQKKLEDVPEPPPGCSDRETAQFNRIAAELLDAGALFEEDIELIAELAAVTAWKKNIDRRRVRLVELLELQAEPDPDFKLNEPPVFAERVDSYLPETDTVPEAYEKAEQDHITIFGERKYSSFDSYRTARRSRESKK